MQNMSGRIREGCCMLKDRELSIIHNRRFTLSMYLHSFENGVEQTHMEGMKMDTSNKQTMDDDLSARLSDEMPHLTISEGPSSGSVTLRSRPRLQATKSFPPYSECIGGLGGDEEWDDVLDVEGNITHSSSDGHEDKASKDPDELFQCTGSEKPFELISRCADDQGKVKWRRKRRERRGGSYEANPAGWDSVWWKGKRAPEAGTETQHGATERDGDTDSEEKQYSSREGSLESDRKEGENEEKRRTPISAEKGEHDGRGEDKEDEGAEELLEMGEGPAMQQWCCRHPILSKLLHSSTSSCSSISLSSAESDEVFSEGEDAGSKRRMFKKCRSWKTYLTMMHWSLRQSSWVQLAGHQGNFQLSDGGEVLKLYSEVEAKCLDSLMRDSLKPFVPQYHGLVTRAEHSYIRLDDLLNGLKRPVIMDCKMGVRTYQEEELLKGPHRADMYQKMMKVDPSALSAEEHARKGVTKLRYLQWKDKTSSTSTLGLRIEGIMMEDGSIQRDFRKIQTIAQVTEVLLFFTKSQLDILKVYHSRLLALSDALKHSLFFRTHEVIGSSLLFVHDRSGAANVWMIDFGKTTPVSNRNELLHNVPWAEGSREDGYLIGLTSLIASLSQAIDTSVSLSTTREQSEKQQ